MFGIGMPELLIILVVALIVVGPKKLPKLAKNLGKGLTEFRRATDEIKSGITEHETYKDINEIKSSIKDTVDSMSPQGLLDVDPVIAPKKPEPNLEGRKAMMDDVLEEHEEAHKATTTDEAIAQTKAEAGGAEAGPAESKPEPDKAESSKADA